MTSTGAAPSPMNLYDLEVTVVSGKHLKNVNWKNGDLKPYVILWVDPNRRQATKPDDSGSTKPVWNERFVLPLTSPPRDSALTLEVFHSKPSETPKPLIGTLQFEIRDILPESDDSCSRIKTLILRRPSGRPQGKIRVKLALLERPAENFQTAPPPSYYYTSNPSPSPSPPLPPRDFTSYSPYSPAPPQPYSYGFYSNPPPTGYYSAYYSPSPRPFYEHRPSYIGGPGPSAPVDYTPYDHHKQNNGNLGIGMSTGLAVGTVTGAMGGLALDDGVKYGDEKFKERAESDLASTTSRGDRYRSEY